MKVPLSWLKEYVDVPVSAAELADRLTFSGLEVEGIAHVGVDYTGVVVAEVLAVERHPQADRLVVCRVHNGREERRVVCGATNFGPGDRVPLAEPGAILANGMKIKSAVIRGERSDGMLCAEDELGLGDRHDGILVLPRDVQPGTPFADIAGPQETVLEIEVTPNRPDCLSMIGVAREVAALLGGSLRWPEIPLEERGGPIGEKTRVDVEDPEGCPRYTARLLEGATVGPAPRWMRQRLTWAGVRPINNIVDVTNYVMLECGQPLHAFDLDCLAERRIVVRRARAAERLMTLDGREHKLAPEMLVISDAAHPVAVAGIMGGESSGITESTQNVLLESACFSASDIRRTAKRMGLSSESSYRFERGVDIGGIEWASRRAASLMAACSGGILARGVIDVFRKPPVPRRVRMRFARARQLLGVELPNEEMTAIFERLQLPVVERDNEQCVVQAPTFRVDLEQEADLIEEVARVHGLDAVPAADPQARLVTDADDTVIRRRQVCRERLRGLGLTEIVNYSFISDRLADLISVGPAEKRVRLPNPLTADHALLRDSLIPQVVETLGRNRARQADRAALFEMGRAFFLNEEGRPTEEERLCVGLMGPIGSSDPIRRAAPSPVEMFLWIKGLLAAVTDALGIGVPGAWPYKADGLRLEPADDLFFEPGFGARVWLGDKPCGRLGLVAGRVREEWRLADPVSVMELLTDMVSQRVFDIPVGRTPSVYPAVDRDVAMVVNQTVTHEAVLRVIQRAAPPELADVRLFDVFEHERLGPGRKSMAYSMTYRSREKTLTDEAVNRLHEAIKKVLRDELAAEIRES